MKPLLYYGDKSRTALYAGDPVSRIGIHPFRPDRVEMTVRNHLGRGGVAYLDLCAELEARVIPRRP